MRVLRVFAVLIPLAVAACSSGGADTKATATSTAAGAGQGTSTAASASSGAPEKEAFVRTCDMSVYGTLDAPAWRKHSIIAGPLAFYYAHQYAKQPASAFAPVAGQNGYYAGQKLLVLVRRGAVATVVVPESERPNAALLYNPSDWNDSNTYRIEDGESAVTFKACKKGETAPVGGPLNAMTQFNGCFLVAGVRCVPLDVLVPGEEQPTRVTLSFGAGRCA